jgi:hypothetical protein
MRATEFLIEYTKDETWNGWTIRHEYGKKKGEPIRWMAFHSKRGPSDAHKGQSDSVDKAIDDAKEWIQSGGNAKKEFTSSVSIDFNVKFVNEILNGSSDRFYAKIVPGPMLIISSTGGEGFKPSHIRTRPSGDEGQTTLLPVISLSSKEAENAGLIPHGRYILGDTTRDSNNNLIFPLIYQSTVQAKGDVWRLSKPALTVAMNRDSAGT